MTARGRHAGKYGPIPCYCGESFRSVRRLIRHGKRCPAHQAVIADAVAFVAAAEVEQESER